MSDYCKARDPHSPRVCDRPIGHEGSHDDSTMPLGEVTRNGVNPAMQPASSPEPAPPTASWQFHCIACGDLSEPCKHFPSWRAYEVPAPIPPAESRRLRLSSE